MCCSEHQKHQKHGSFRHQNMCVCCSQSSRRKQKMKSQENMGLFTVQASTMIPREPMVRDSTSRVTGALKGSYGHILKGFLSPNPLDPNP